MVSPRDQQLTWAQVIVLDWRQERVELVGACAAARVAVHEHVVGLPGLHYPGQRLGAIADRAVLAVQLVLLAVAARTQ